MPKIYDNIENKLKEGLNKTLEKAKKADFCIGYFNLRGWRQLYKNVDTLSGDYLPEQYEDDTKYYCRILIGMQRYPKYRMGKELDAYIEKILDHEIGDNS